jgi:hypothetical protein
MNIILVQKEGELYAFYYDDETASVAALIETAARFAGDPRLSFAWDDALGVADTQERLEQAHAALRDIRGSGE